MSTTVLAGVFQQHEAAEQAINDLVRDGLPRDKISVVARDEVYKRAIPGGTGPTGEQIPTDQAARVAGLDEATEPRMGELLAAGPLGPLLEKAEHTAPDPLVAALTRLGIPEPDAVRCTDHVRRGAVLLVAEADGTHAERTRQRLRDDGATDVVDGVRPT